MKLSRVNTYLLIAICLINSYIIVLPVIPGILFWAQTHNHARQQTLQRAIVTPQSAVTPSPSGNWLTIPAMVLNEQIHEGKTMTTLRQGLWRLPYTSTPDKGGNTVIVGHRFTYTNPRGTLYSLDKVHIGNEIGLTWNNRKYLYKVRQIEQVHASDVAVEAPTAAPQLTIYTCTPLWLPKDRLVVIADLEKIL